MSYRPICDTWLLARSKVKYYGAYPAGFLGRARDLLGVHADDCVLHVCSGRVFEYPFKGLGDSDKTVDIDPELCPTFCGDVRSSEFWDRIREGLNPNYADAVLIDRPYTEEDATHYRLGTGILPDLNFLVRQGLDTVAEGGKVGVLDYFIPRPPAEARFVACVGVVVGFGNRGRFFTVFEKPVTT